MKAVIIMLVVIVIFEAWYIVSIDERVTKLYKSLNEAGKVLDEVTDILKETAEEIKEKIENGTD